MGRTFKDSEKFERSRGKRTDRTERLSQKHMTNALRHCDVEEILHADGFDAEPVETPTMPEKVGDG